MNVVITHIEPQSSKWNGKTEGNIKAKGDRAERGTECMDDAKLGRCRSFNAGESFRA
jgi:hypothetical protein